MIDTEMIERFTGGQAEAATAMTALEPVGRMGRPEEIADAVVWLCSDRSSFTTGQAIAVDGASSPADPATSADRGEGRNSSTASSHPR